MISAVRPLARAAANDPAPVLQAGAVADYHLVVRVRFVTIEVAHRLTGYTPAAIRTKIGKGEWLEGRQYVRRDGRVLIDMEGYEKWAETGRA